MKEIPCICNGSRGTDCDYCGGSGFITEPFHIPGNPPNDTNSNKKDIISDALQIINNELEIISTQIDNKTIRLSKRKSHRHGIANRLASLSNKVFELKRRMSISEGKVYDPIFKRINDLKLILFSKKK